MFRNVSESDDFLTLRNDRLRYVYDKRAGLFTRMAFDGTEWLDKPMGWNVWRAPSDNDRKIKLEWLAAHTVLCLDYRQNGACSQKSERK